jgi:hypothetical protein
MKIIIKDRSVNNSARLTAENTPSVIRSRHIDTLYDFIRVYVNEMLRIFF